MYSKPSLDIDLDEEYVLGLIDYLSRPSLVPYKSGNGYGLDAKVNISLRKSEILLGVISQFFDSEELTIVINVVTQKVSRTRYW